MPGLSIEQATELLLDAAAHRRVTMRERTLAGDLQWRLTDPDVVAVVRPDRWDRNGLVVMTVLPTFADVPSARHVATVLRNGASLGLGSRRKAPAPQPPAEPRRYSGKLKRVAGAAAIEAVVQAEYAVWTAVGPVRPAQAEGRDEP